MIRWLVSAAMLLALSHQPPPTARATTTNGPVEGVTEADGLRVFKGIPYAAPPVGTRRWQPPQAPDKWNEPRPATTFASQCMQRRMFADMVFRASGNSEDCLYLNVWTPARRASERLPVLVYFYGGGFTSGDGSEPRYDGAAMARRGIVALTVNYRLNISPSSSKQVTLTARGCPNGRRSRTARCCISTSTRGRNRMRLANATSSSIAGTRKNSRRRPDACNLPPALT